MILELVGGAHRSCGSDAWTKRDEEPAWGTREGKGHTGIQVVDRQCCNKTWELRKQAEGRPAGSKLSSPLLPVPGKDLTGSAASICVCVSSSLYVFVCPLQ